MKILLIGSSGMLGQALRAEMRSRGAEVVGLDRAGAEISADICKDDDLAQAIRDTAPAAVINCAAIVDLGLCESDPLLAYQINARAVGVMAEKCHASDIPFVHVSTDHYFSGDGDRLHREDAQVIFLNEYARTKFAGEGFALAFPDSLVLRTNIVGFRGHGKPTFAEWAFDAVERDAPMVLFEDSYVSCIDVGSFSTAIADLLAKRAAGLYNLANREVFSKKDFIEAIASRLGRRLSKAETGSVASLGVRRADSCGLDVSRAESILGRPLPGLAEVVDRLARRRVAGQNGISGDTEGP